MKTFYLTDSGKVRDHNEDSVTILKNANNEQLLIVAVHFALVQVPDVQAARFFRYGFDTL